MLAITCCGTVIPTSIFEFSNPRLFSSALSPGARFEKSASALKSRSTSEF
jgi:hypothetical protein